MATATTIAARLHPLWKTSPLFLLHRAKTAHVATATRSSNTHDEAELHPRPDNTWDRLQASEEDIENQTGEERSVSCKGVTE
ncbi:zinc finger CCCH domain-containing protein 24 [Sesbania bispinosa]|nr:zinc finger CCCH domain-containing protein 24 [Sesbania bispinosa]